MLPEVLDDGAIPDRLGAELAGAEVELHARQVGLVVRGRALDDQRARVEREDAATGPRHWWWSPAELIASSPQV